MSNATNSDSTKVVQTELAPEDYQLFRDLATERDLSLKTALAEAAKDWVEDQQQVDPDDPLFITIEQIDSEPPVGESTTTADMEADLYGEWREHDEQGVDDESESER